MRKCLILLLLLSLLSVGGIVCAHRTVDALSDKVTFAEETHSGELSAAEGLVVNLNTQMEQNLFWKTEYPLGGTPKTDFAFYQTDQYEPYHREQYGLSVSFPSGYGWSSDRGTNYENFSEEDIDGMSTDYVLLPILQDVSRNTAPNSEHTEQVRVVDYFEYLPLIFYLDDEDVFYVLEEDGYENVYPMSYVSDAASPLSAALNDYFRIPTPEDMLLKISMYKDSSGLITELNVNSTFDEDSGVSTPTFEVHSAVTEQGCFFTFSGHCYDVDSNRYPLNIGNVQGGAGVYFLPYTSGTSREKGVKYVDLEGFGSVYAFENEEVSPQELHVLEDGQTLLLTTQEGKTLYLNVIDLTTGKRAQKLPLMDMGERSLRHVWYEDGFLVHLCYDDCFVLSQLTETGYEVRIKGVLGEGESMDKACYADLVDLAYNGEKLGVVFPIYRTESYYANASIGVMVYDTTGLLYSGTHISSLDTGSEEYRQRVTCSDGQPLMVHWVS